MIALPQAAFFLLLEASAGGAIALFLIHLRGEVGRGFTLFTGLCLLVLGVLAVWLRATFPPSVDLALSASAQLWFAVERTLSIAFLVLLGIYLLTLARQRWSTPQTRLIGPVIPLLALGSLWSAALVSTSPQLFGLGTPLAVLAGAMALGSAIAALSLGHWYLVTPSLSVRPLIQVTLLCLGALAVQSVLVILLLALADPAAREKLLSEYGVFLGVRVVFGLVVPLVATFMTWRTARIRSIDSATGLLYIAAALILAGEIAARTLFFLTGLAT